MASGYQKSGNDLDNLCEPFVASKPVSSSGYDLSGYTINGGSIANRYNKPNTDPWAMSYSSYKSHGEVVPICSKGMLPTQTKFAEITSPGTYNITVSSSGITIGSTTYGTSTFRGNRIPKFIGIVIVGAGGGGGGFGADQGDKNGFSRKPSGGGGGGGVMCGVVATGNHPGSEPMIYQIVIGTGGAGGAWGSGDSRPSTGAKGVDGGDSYVICRERGLTTNIYAAKALGGKGGAGGVGNGGNSIGGSGGAFVEYDEYEEPTSNPFYHKTAGVKQGGKGGDYIVGGNCTGGDALSITNFSFTTGAGVPSSTMFNNASSGYLYSGNDSFRASWNGGGASFGNGGTNSTAATKGGGGCSNANSTGANGYCAFYY